jgi:hypothetical protein
MAHLDSETLILKQRYGHEFVEVGALYYHYRNPHILYRVLAIGFQEATDELCVIYQSLSDDIIWVRNLGSWLSTITQEDKTVKRFIKAS